HTAALVVHQEPAGCRPIVTDLANTRTVPHEGDEAPSSYKPIAQLANVASTPRRWRNRPQTSLSVERSASGAAGERPTRRTSGSQPARRRLDVAVRRRPRLLVSAASHRLRQ